MSMKTAAHGLRSRGAFTLVELLVVVAIIAVLIAVLLPAVNKAKQQAQAIRCMGNIHQVSIAQLTYATDNAGLITSPSYTDHGDTRIWWRGLQGQYGGATYLQAEKTPNGANRVFICPRAGKRRPGTYGMYSVRSEDSCYFSVANFSGLRLTNASNPGDFMLVADTSISDGTQSTFDIDEGSYMWVPHRAWSGGANAMALWAPHLNRVNGSFADGHVQACDADKLLGAANYNPIYHKPTITYWKNEDFTISSY